MASKSMFDVSSDEEDTAEVINVAKQIAPSKSNQNSKGPKPSQSCGGSESNEFISVKL